MTARQYLKQIERCLENIKARDKKLEELRDEMNLSGVQGIRYDRDKVQTSATNTFEDRYIKYLEKSEKLRIEALDEREEYIRLRDQIEREIESLIDLRYVKILRRKYIYVWNYRQICDELNYDYAYARSLNMDALDAFYEKFKDVHNLEKEERKHHTQSNSKV